MSSNFLMMVPIAAPTPSRTKRKPRWRPLRLGLRVAGLDGGVVGWIENYLVGLPFWNDFVFVLIRKGKSALASVDVEGLRVDDADLTDCRRVCDRAYDRGVGIQLEARGQMGGKNQRACCEIGAHAWGARR